MAGSELEGKELSAAIQSPLSPFSSSDDIQTASHRIHASLAPRVAILNSPDVDEVLAPNNFDSFAELLKPFQESVENLSVRTSQLETRQCRTFPLSFDHLDLFAASQTISTSSLFTPADLIEQNEQSSPQKKARSVPFSRPEILLDAISARVRNKSKALWESRAKMEGNEAKIRPHRRKPSMYAPKVEFEIPVDDISTGNVDLQKYRDAEIDSISPWFADTRDMILQARRISEHETFGHPAAVLLIVSTSSSDPMNAFANLFEESQAHANSAFSKRPYVDPLIFRYYVLLHDVSKSGPDLTEAISILENVKKTYGLHCCLLPVNSVTSDVPRNDGISALWQRALRSSTSYANLAAKDEMLPSSPTKRQSIDALRKWHGEENSEEEKEYASLINEDDVRRIRTFIRDFAAQSFIPFMERCVSLWNEQLAASRRGLTGRLLGAGRKLFGGASRGAGSNQPSQSFSALGYYPHASIEAQTRRLADFAFMTHDYKLAASMYDLCRKDFANDKANKYIAGANEMFGLSHLMIMMSTPNALIDVDSYLAAAGSYYLIAPRQKGSALQLDGLRATLLYYEAYRGLHFYRPAPGALVRTANEGSSEDENDLEVVAAMLLEQAALASLRQPGKPALRKCALHLIMAAHRYRKCGQKHLSLRCFGASAQFYKMLQKANALPLLDKNTESTKGTSEEDDRVRLTDFIAGHERLQIREWELINDHMENEMAQQAFNDGDIGQALAYYTQIIQRQATSFEALSEDSAPRHATYFQGFLTCCKYLDEDVCAVLDRHGLKPALYLIDGSKTAVEVNASTQRDDTPWRELEERVLGHSVSKKYKEQNTTAIGETFWANVTLQNPLNIPLFIVSLTIEFVDGATNKTIASDGSISIKAIESFTLQPLEVRQISLGVICHSSKTLRLSAVRYRLTDEIELKEDIVKNGKRLNDTRDQRTSEQPMYATNETLSVIVHESKAILEANLIDAPSRLGLGGEVTVTMKLVNVGKAALRNASIHVNKPDSLIDPNQSGVNFSTAKEGFVNVDNSLRSVESIKIPLLDETLKGGDSYSWTLTLRGSTLGYLTIRALIVFEAENGERLTSQVQHTVQVNPVLDLSIQSVPARTEKVQYQLRLDAINLLESVEGTSDKQQKIVIDRLSFIGPSWVVNTSHTEEILAPFQGIAQNERRSINLFIEPLVLEQDADAIKPIVDLDFSVNQLRSLLMGRGLNNSAFPPETRLSISHSDQNQDDTTLSPFLLLARKEYKLTMLSSEFPLLLKRREGNKKGYVEDDQLRRIFPLYEPCEVDVIAHWRITDDEANAGKDRTGQAFIFGLHLGPSIDYLANLFSTPENSSEQEKYIRTMYAETENEKASIWQNLRQSRLHIEDDPIMFEFSLPSSADLQDKKHDFSQNGRKLIDIQFIIRNLSPRSTRKVILKLDNTSPPTGSAATAMAAAMAPTSTKSLTPVQSSYVGRLRLTTTIAPLSRLVLDGKASISRAGRIFFAPVLVTNTDEQSSQTTTFQRWEYCSRFVDIE